MSVQNADTKPLLYIQGNILQMTSMQDIAFQTDTSNYRFYFVVLLDDSIVIVDTRAASASTGWLVVGSVFSDAI